ncbi:MAG: response regulator transcription factor [Coriobacteriia bacterium]|nr:response regulator transcription factor [Coriobacteriia bacterium]MBS5478862.1 response regulator transcription factor [Coriobacteriia bacterium]
MALRIPRLSLHIESDESSSVGELRGEALGLGLIVLLVLDVLLGGAGSLATGEPTVQRISCCAAGTAALLAGGLADTRLHALFRRSSSIAVGSTLMLVGACLSIVAIVVGGALKIPMQLAGGALMGLGLALLTFLWGIAFGRLDLTDVSLNAVVGTALGILAYTFFASRLPVPWGHAIVGALQMAHVVLLRNRVTDRLPDPDMREATYFSELQIKRFSFAVKIVPTLMSLGIVLGCLITHAGFVMKPSAGATGEVGTAVAALVGSALALGACVVARRKGQSFGHAFRTILPLVALLILPLALTRAATVSTPAVSLLTAFVIGATMCWAYLGSLAQGFRLSPVFVFGLGEGSLALGYLLATPLNLYVQPAVGETLSGEVFGLVTSLACLVIATGLFPRRDDILAIVVRPYRPSALWGADAEQDGPCASCARKAQGTCPADDGEPASPTAPEAAPSQLPRSHAGTPYVQPGIGSVIPGDAASARGEENAGGEGDGDTVRKGRFVRRCEYVADTFLLSRRETDVLFLLAKGRNVSFICEQLYISEGTAKTHVNHVYKKLGVHSRQELIKLIDEFEA